ncbi:phosphopantothenate--cysteine ligase [Thermoanaerobacterium thermosaccharolyticum]|uniref:Phosphopantothenate--cysteine ligase n=1 Tax=Thermoanaerobacterium thermosaccharolyticum TaxID=1517 RepID=A0A223HZP4_THETR|nr:flavoprotein [Thermoanaerobacterium thermosaccharolyticum]AST57940.1 phosphopantothenate--cysteine ligase [Thermoanaerobacterium thermosaccharolyticum]
MDIEKLIEKVYIEVLKRIGRKALLFFSGTPLNVDFILSDLKNIANIYNIYYKSVLSDAAKNVIGKDKISNISDILEEKNEITESIKEADFILVASLTRNTLAKVALGIQDTKVTLGVAEAFMLNKKIIVVKDGADFENQFRISNGMAKNEEYNRMLLNYFKIWESFGATLINSSDLFDTIKSLFDFDFQMRNYRDDIFNDAKLNSNVITLQDLLGMGKAKTIYIKKNAIVTPLANDYIMNNNIRLVREE